jgi:two-component system cell cycle response regulator
VPKILIVDDVVDNVKLLSLCLYDEGYEIATAYNGQEALEAVDREAPDAILLDIMMPIMDGIEVCRRLRRHPEHRTIPIILVTALSQEDDVICGLDAGADDYINKPFNPRVVAARTRAAVNRYMIQLENKRLVAELQVLATTDSLTGIRNRRTFFTLFEQEWRRADRTQAPLSCVMIDVDRFKNLNDTYGHQTGDKVLKQIAHTLDDGLRKSDVLCRYGGEEFCVILPETPVDGAAIWANRQRQAIEELSFPHGEATIKVSASFGVAKRETETNCVDALVNDADLALLHSKSTTRNTVTLFHPENMIPFGPPIAVPT